MRRYMLVYQSPEGYAGTFFFDTYEDAEPVEDGLIHLGFFCELYERVECGVGLEYRCTYR